ncbi:CZB domain-containing protein [Catenovulum sp. 2E275]|uniref:CZB domain-containing protein n=1 Tax=Catenovulum sp. 2E275 TaxID=2980497 RepID=UPI0021CE494C|nr:CZB domain-containing protein [Catenovulum sp. 2E275]MCU4674918.1 CZB domain-containing protein [Catenovulum sp. 2E275]
MKIKQAKPMEVVNFRVGNYLVAFNILEILLTEKFTNDQTSVPTEDSAFLGVKNFMGTPTPIYDLGLAMNKKSTQTQNTDLITLLNKKEEEHQVWFDALTQSINKNQTFTQARDINKCELTQWLQSVKTQSEDLAELFSRFEPPHTRLHLIADKALTLLENKQQEQAIKLIEQEKKTTFASLQRLFAITREQLELAYKPVTVYTTIDGLKPALGFVVDKVEDSLTVNNEQIKPLTDIVQYTGNIDHRVKSMIKGLLSGKKYNSLLLSSKAFIPTNSIC